MGGNQLCLSHVNIFLFLSSFSLPPSLPLILKINENNPLVRILKEKKIRKGRLGSMGIQWKTMRQDLMDELAAVLSPGFTLESPGGRVLYFLSLF